MSENEGKNNMQCITYVNPRSERKADAFSDEYILISHDLELQGIAKDYRLDENPTSAYMRDDEIWVTFSNAPYLSDTRYNRITRYMRNEYAKYAVSSGQWGCIPNQIDTYVTKKDAMAAFFEELERSIDAGYECGSLPSKREVMRGLAAGGYIAEFDRNEYVMIEKYDPF